MGRKSKNKIDEYGLGKVHIDLIKKIYDLLKLDDSIISFDVYKKEIFNAWYIVYKIQHGFISSFERFLNNYIYAIKTTPNLDDYIKEKHKKYKGEWGDFLKTMEINWEDINN
jgi:hypothetical protein